MSVNISLNILESQQDAPTKFLSLACRKKGFYFSGLYLPFLSRLFPSALFFYTRGVNFNALLLLFGKHADLHI